MGCSASSNHSNKITRCNGIGRSAAQSLSGILTFNTSLGQRQATRSHGTVLTAGALVPDIAGFHGYRPVKNRIDTQFLRSSLHLLRGRINGDRSRIS